MFSCEFYEISKNTFFYSTPLVAASDFVRIWSYYNQTILEAVVRICSSKQVFLKILQKSQKNT